MGCGASSDANVEKKQFLFRVRLLGGLNLYNNSFGVQAPGTYSNAGRFEGKSDPYATIQCSGTTAVCTSQVRIHEQNPVWNEEFYFNTNTNAPILTITVKDKDVLSGDDVIGKATVNLHGLVTKTKEREMWLPLEGAKAKGEVGIAVVECFRTKITAKQGINVKPMDSFSGSSDCYMTLQVGQQPAHKTAAKKWTLNPVWNETFTVFVPYSIKSQLAMILYDHDSVGTDNNMGWHYEYFDGKPKTGPRNLKCPITNATGELEFTMLDDTTLEGVTDAGPVPDAVKAKWPSEKPLGCLFECRVLGAFNLAVADYNVAGDLASLAAGEVYHEFKEYTGNSDPFARVTCEGVTYDTRHINGTLEPVWNEKFRFVANNREESALVIEVLDHDLVVNDSIGSVKIPIKSMKPGKRQEIWSFLDKGRGEIGVEVIQHHQLHVRVVSGTNLPAKDMNGMCDPYVRLKLGGQQYQTRVVRNDRNPWFEEDFRFCLPQLKNLKLELNVWDSDLMIFRKGMSEDLIGNGEIDVSNLVPGLPNEFTVKLKTGTKQEGEIKVIITEEVPLPPKVLDELLNKGKEAFEAMVKGLNEAKEMVACMKLPDFDKKEEAKFEVADPKLAPRPRFGKIDVEVVAVRGMRKCTEPFSVGVALPQQGKRFKTKEYREPRGVDIHEHFVFNVPSKLTGSLEFRVFESSKANYLDWTDVCYARQIVHFKDLNKGEGMVRGAKPDDEWKTLGNEEQGKIIFRVREMYRYQVRVLSAKNLKTDKDPFIVIKLEDQVRTTSYVSSNPEKDRTTGIPGNPKWGEQFTLFAKEKSIIEFKLMDLGVVNDAFLGKVEFDLANVRRGVLFKTDLALPNGATLQVEILEEEKMALVDQIIDAAANAARLAEALAAELKAAAGAAAADAAAAVTGAAGAAAGAIGGALGKLF